MDIIFSIIREDTFWKILLFWSLPDGRRPAGGGHASGGVGFDIGATSGGRAAAVFGLRAASASPASRCS